MKIKQKNKYRMLPLWVQNSFTLNKIKIKEKILQLEVSKEVVSQSLNYKDSDEILLESFQSLAR